MERSGLTKDFKPVSFPGVLGWDLSGIVIIMSATSAAFQQTQLLMSLQLASPISSPLIVIVVSWAMFLFFRFGLTSGLDPTSLAALALGSSAVASAIFLILELNQPLSGLFRVPSAPIERTIAALGPRAINVKASQEE